MHFSQSDALGSIGHEECIFTFLAAPPPDCSKPITLLIILFNSQPISMKPILSLFAAFALAGQLTAQNR